MNKNELQNIYRKVYNDFIFFANNFLKIRTKIQTVEHFILNKEQSYITRVLNKQKRKTGKVKALILKSRQIGITTLIAAYNYHSMLTNRGIKSLVLTHRQSATNNIYGVMNRFYKNSPFFLKFPSSFRKHSEIYINDLDSGCLFATAGGNDIGRSESIQFFHGSEVAFWPNAEEHIASVLMTISLEKGIHIMLESTSNGSNNLFYELCLDSIKKNNDFLFIFIPWFWHKEYKSDDIYKWHPSKEWLAYKEEYNISLKQLHWAYLKNQILCKMTNENKDSGPSTYFKREFPSNYQEAFLNSSQDNTLVPLENLIRKSVKLETLNNINASLNPELEILKQKRLLQNSANIVLGVDVARGGGDLSWIIDRQGDFLGFNLNEKVNINDTMQLAYWIAKHIQSIKPYKVFIDSGGLGIAVVDRLKELNYGNIVIPINFASRAISYNKFINKRAEIWYLLKQFIEDNGYIVNDPLLLKQISSIKGFYNLKGLFQLEDKEKVRSVIKHSPDGGDAAALTFSNINSTIIKSSIIETNYNPFSW